MKNNYTIILVEPQSDENLGAVARAMNNFFFNKLVLISPIASISSKAALATAHGSEKILINSGLAKNLKSAIEQQHIVIGTTQRKRKAGEPFLHLKELKKKISIETEAKNIAFVFGSEKTGLTNTQLALCDLICTIPTITKQPSLNLAQAVMLFLYEFSEISETKNSSTTYLATKKDTERLKSSFVKLLENTGFKAADTISGFVNLLFRSLKRSGLEERDVNAWMKFIQHLNGRDGK